MGERTYNRTGARACLSMAAALFLVAGGAEALAQNGSGLRSMPPTAAGGQAGDGGSAPAAGGSEKVKVDEHLIVDLHVNDEDLSNVLQMLSIQSQRNIVTSKSVSAVVTANLYGVTFYEALDAILHVNGYGYMERGNFIYVYTLEELKTIAEAGRQRVWKLTKLNYLNSVDAAEFVKPLLSEGGQIKTNGKPAAIAGSGDAPTTGEDFAHDSTMVIYDYEENLAEIEKILKEMDTRPAQVLVEATILQTSLSEANAFGVDFSIIADMDFSDFVNIGGPLGAVNGLISGGGSDGSSGSGGSGGSGGGGSGGGSATPIPADNIGRAIVSSPGNTAGPGTLKMGIVANDVAAFLKVLDEVTDTTIISRPNVLTLNRQPARVLVGRKVGYLSSTSTDTSTTQTVEFLDTGTQLYLRPFVSSDGMIRMELKPKVSEAVIRNVTNTGGAAVTIPDEISNELTANVMVRDGQTIVLGGLFRESTQASRRQVPWLGDVPIVGAAFRGNDDSTERSEIIFMITPTIVSDAVLLEQGGRATAMVDRVRAGSREGLLPWSRDKRTQQMIVQATELARQGKTDQALYKVQRALALNHFQPDAIELREMLMNRKAAWPTRNMGHEIITGEIEKAISEAPAPRASSKRGAPKAEPRTEAKPSVRAEPVPEASPAPSPAKAKAAPAMSVSVETLETFDPPTRAGTADSQPVETVWLPAAELEQGEDESWSTMVADSAPARTTAAPAGPEPKFPSPGLEVVMESFGMTADGTTAAPAARGASAASPAIPATVASPASAGPVSSMGFWRLSKLYLDYTRRQVSPGSVDSVVTSAPSEGDIK